MVRTATRLPLDQTIVFGTREFDVNSYTRRLSLTDVLKLLRQPGNVSRLCTTHRARAVSRWLGKSPGIDV